MLFYLGLRSKSTFRGRLIAMATIGLFLSACDRGPEIQLKNETLNKLPSTVTVPKPGDGLDPSGGEQGSSRIGYRIFCEAPTGDADGTFMTGSAQADAKTERIPLTLTETIGVSVVGIRNLLPLGKFESFYGRFVFEAESVRFGEGWKSARQIYLGEIDVAGREGAATVVAKVPEFDPGAVELAARLRLDLRAFGVSSRGSWIVVPAPDGRLSLRRSADLSEAGVLDLSARRTFFPAFDESSGLLSFTAFENGRFVNRLMRLGVKTGGSIAVVQNIEMPIPPVSWTAIGPAAESAGGRGRAWGERPIRAPESAVAMVIADISGESSVRRSVFDSSGMSGWRIGSPTIIHKDEGETSMVAALEPTSNSANRAHGKFVLLKPTGDRLQVVNEWNYPALDLRLSELASSFDQERWIGVLAHGSNSVDALVVRALDGELVETGAGACRAPALIQEEL